HHFEPEFASELGCAFNALVPVQLQDVGPQRPHDVRKGGIVGIHRQRDLFGAAAHLSAEFARGVERKMPRRRREEHETHHVSARTERRIERLARGQAAYFDQQGHRSRLAKNASCEKSCDEKVSAEEALTRRFTTLRPACLAREPRKRRAARAREDRGCPAAWWRAVGPDRFSPSGHRPHGGAPPAANAVARTRWRTRPQSRRLWRPQ